MTLRLLLSIEFIWRKPMSLRLNRTLNKRYTYGYMNILILTLYFRKKYYVMSYIAEEVQITIMHCQSRHITVNGHSISFSIYNLKLSWLTLNKDLYGVSLCPFCLSWHWIKNILMTTWTSWFGFRPSFQRKNYLM